MPELAKPSSSGPARPLSALSISSGTSASPVASGEVSGAVKNRGSMAMAKPAAVLAKLLLLSVISLDSASLASGNCGKALPVMAVVVNSFGGCKGV